MSNERTRRAVAAFLAADTPALDKLRHLRLLAELARTIGRGGPVAAGDRDDAIRMLVDQSPHRSWDKSRISEARLVFDFHVNVNEAVAHLQASGAPYTWHDVVWVLRRLRDGQPVSSSRRGKTDTLRNALSRFARQHGLSVHTVEHRSNRVIATFKVKTAQK